MSCSSDERIGRARFYQDFSSQYTITYTEPEYDRVDFYCTATTDPSRTYVGDIKSYHNPEHPRPYSKFIKDGRDYGYQIDYDKCYNVVERAKVSDSIPIIVAYFSDCTLIWDLSIIDWESTKRWVKTNKYGQAYGEDKEYSWQVYLYKEQAKYCKEVQHD